MQKLFTNNSPKIEKSDKAGLGYLTQIMYLAPAKLSGYQLCPNASAGCIASCLNTSGHGRYQRVQQSRIKKTLSFFSDREAFKRQMIDEIRHFVKRCWKVGLKPAVRANGTSDLAWELMFPELFKIFPHVQFYDYTKSFNRMMKFLTGNFPRNYYLTFSRSEVNEEKCIQVLNCGGNVAVVFQNKNFPLAWKGFPVYNMDEHDLRFLDPKGVGALYAKGRAKRDTTGFVLES